MKSNIYNMDGSSTITLQRVKPLESWPSISAGRPICKIAVIDTETTGFDPRRDKIIEFAYAIIEVDHNGLIARICEYGSMLNDPGIHLPSRIKLLTGLDDDDLLGRVIDPDMLCHILQKCDAILCHNAAFDRPFIEELLPALPAMSWICSMTDIDWLVEGFDGAKLGHLIMQCGLFNPEAHRAIDDVTTLINLLASPLSRGQSVLARVMEGATRPSWRFEATLAGYHLRAELRAHGYRWCDQKVWHKHVREDDYFEELAWYYAVIGGSPSIIDLDQTTRYRPDWSWSTVR